MLARSLLIVMVLGGIAAAGPKNKKGEGEEAPPPPPAETKPKNKNKEAAPAPDAPAPPADKPKKNKDKQADAAPAPTPAPPADKPTKNKDKQADAAPPPAAPGKAAPPPSSGSGSLKPGQAVGVRACLGSTSGIGAIEVTSKNTYGVATCNGELKRVFLEKGICKGKAKSTKMEYGWQFADTTGKDYVLCP